MPGTRPSGAGELSLPYCGPLGAIYFAMNWEKRTERAGPTRLPRFPPLYVTRRDSPTTAETD